MKDEYIGDSPEETNDGILRSFFRRLINPTPKEWGVNNDLLMVILMLIIVGVSLWVILWS
jgi:hypothetical protein